MEKLSLKKIEDFQIANESLKVVKGGIDICTDGRFENTWERDGNSYVLVNTETWSSDTNGGKTGSVRKHGIRMVYAN